MPEAQLDRFMFKILVDYPSEQEEFQIVKLTTSEHSGAIQKVLGASDIMDLQRIVRRVPCSDRVVRYAMKLVRWTRRGRQEAPGFVEDYVAWGAGPRASQHLVMAGKARALLRGRFCVSTEDIRHVAFPVLRHRIITNFNAEADGIASDRLIEMLIAEMPPDESERIDDAVANRIFATGEERLEG